MTTNNRIKTIAVPCLSGLYLEDLEGIDLLSALQKSGEDLSTCLKGSNLVSQDFRESDISGVCFEGARVWQFQFTPNQWNEVLKQNPEVVTIQNKELLTPDLQIALEDGLRLQTEPTSFHAIKEYIREAAIQSGASTSTFLKIVLDGGSPLTNTVHASAGADYVAQSAPYSHDLVTDLEIVVVKSTYQASFKCNPQSALYLADISSPVGKTRVIFVPSASLSNNSRNFCAFGDSELELFEFSDDWWAFKPENTIQILNYIDCFPDEFVYLELSL